MKDLINNKNKKKAEEDNYEDEQQEEPDNEAENEEELGPEGEGGGEGEGEIDQEKNEQKLLLEQLEKQKKTEDIFPTYKLDNAPELVLFLYNKISQIYDIHKQKYLLLLLLFFALKDKEEIPSNFKNIIQNVNRICFNKNTELNENNQNNQNNKSPISQISDLTWNYRLYKKKSIINSRKR